MRDLLALVLDGSMKLCYLAKVYENGYKKYKAGQPNKVLVCRYMINLLKILHKKFFFAILTKPINQSSFQLFIFRTS